METLDLRTTLVSIVTFLGGFVVGAGCFVGLFYLSLLLESSSPLKDIMPAYKGVEFGMSIGADVTFLCACIGGGIGIIALLVRPIHALLRTSLFGVALPLLGFFTLCSYLSINDLFSAPH